MLPEITLKPCCDSPKLATSVEPVMSRKQRTLLFQKLTDRHYLASQGIVVRTDITGISFEIPINFDTILERIAKTIRRQQGLPVTSLHSIRIRHYRVGDSHPPHCDHYERESDHLLATTRRLKRQACSLAFSFTINVSR